MPIFSHFIPVDNPLGVIHSQRMFIDRGIWSSLASPPPVGDGDDSIDKAFNRVNGADNLIVKRRKRVATLCGPDSKKDGSVAGKFTAFPPPVGPVCKPNLLIAKAGLAFGFVPF